MAVLSMKSRHKLSGIIMSAIVASLVWILQISVLNNFRFEGIIVNLPLALTILWGMVLGSNTRQFTSDDLRYRSTADIFMQQMSSGSIYGALFGAFIAALYASVLPIYPLCYPLIGWIAGYFSLPKVNQETLICIPVVLFGTAIAEIIMAGQLHFFYSRPDVFSHLSKMVLPEGLMNALVAPFIYFPLRSWVDFARNSAIMED